MKQKPEKEKRRTLFGAFFSKPEKDEEYLPDLKAQWGKMDRNEKRKFIFGAVVGLILFIGALYLTFILLSSFAR